MARKAPRFTPKIQQTLPRSQRSRWYQTSPQRPQASTSCLDSLHFPVIFSSFDAAEVHLPDASHPTNRRPLLLLYSGGSTPSVSVSVLYSHSHQRHLSAAPTRLASQGNQFRGSHVAWLRIRRSASVCSRSYGMPWPKVRLCFIPFNLVSIIDVFFIVCIKPCGRAKLHSQGQRCPRRLPSTSMTGLRSHPHIWQPSTHQVPRVLSRGAS